MFKRYINVHMTTLLVNYLCGAHCAEEREDDDWTTRAVVHLYRTQKNADSGLVDLVKPLQWSHW